MKQYSDLLVSEYFYSIQGEGIYAGRPAVFLRLKGCNLLCGGIGSLQSGKCEQGATWRCDTMDVWTKGEPQSFESICNNWQDRNWIDALQKGAHLVITGGEPLLQDKSLAGFLTYFIQRYLFKPFIEVETNGTITPDPSCDHFIDHYNVSFKTENSGMKPKTFLNPNSVLFFSKRTNVSFKCVVSEKQDIDSFMKHFVIPYDLDRSRILCMPAADSQESLHQLGPHVVEWCKAYCFRYSSRLHISLWDKKTGV